MAKPSTSKPTDAELAILDMLWRQGPSTVRQVHDALGRRRGVGYTTVLKLMQIMLDKHLVRRRALARGSRIHVYEPAVSRQRTQRRLLRELINRAFGGSARGLVMEALASKKPSPRELAEIRAIIEEMEQSR